MFVFIMKKTLFSSEKMFLFRSWPVAGGTKGCPTLFPGNISIILCYLSIYIARFLLIHF
jgi:hypothetical protein